MGIKGDRFKVNGKSKVEFEVKIVLRKGQVVGRVNPRLSQKMEGIVSME